MSLGRAHPVRQEKNGGRLYVTFKVWPSCSVRFYAPGDTQATPGMKVKCSKRGYISGVEFVPPSYLQTRKRHAAHIIPWLPIVDKGEEVWSSEKWVEDWDGKQPDGD